MRTFFSPEQLADPHIAEAEQALRACVHCGICTATCPTYVLLGDERDGPRGRIVMMQRMLEQGGVPSPETVTHVDRCLSCLACRTACPSGVDYARLADAARTHIATHYRRPLGERLTRWAISHLLTRPALAKTGVVLAKTFAPIARRVPGRLGAMARIALKARPKFSLKAHDPIADVPFVTRARNVALMPGCVQSVLAPSIDAAILRVLARRGIGVKPLAGCCGALKHHLGEDARGEAKRVIASFETMDCESVLVGATGCSAHLLDTPHLFAGDPAWEPRAKVFAAKVRDFSLLVTPRPARVRGLRVAWQAPCSMQNSLKTAGVGKALLEAAGYDVAEIPEGHLCCGSAGSYSLLQPEIAGALRARKLANAAAAGPDMIATANIGCLIHLSGEIPVVHLAELIDWAEGGPRPACLEGAPR
ncbi:MAG TPA: glycolate oxidase subunit GlcF [Rhizomicrobium sp.]|jgi:glycolate oxidase iron-sulfur subunit